MSKCINKLATVYLCNMFTLRTLLFDLRDARQKLYLLKPTAHDLKHSFNDFSRASLWNDLPEELHTTKSLHIFMKSINGWFYASDSHTADIKP